MSKEALRDAFSRDPSRYYEVELFRKEGFRRKKCVSCGRYFWTLDPARQTHPDQPCEPYQFLGKPPTSKRLDYISMWREIEGFFTSRGHSSISRYPVVCRWRPDLYFTVASIIDFQRVEGAKVVFELPANPLVVPQMSLRFNDITNVGLSGKHYTCFCMWGQHAISSGGGYWKDRCIELDFELLTKALGINPQEVVFVEDVWLGYGAFGYSLEYFVRGLELGNAVFTEFEGTPDNYRVMEDKVVDHGGGLEHFVWLSQGSPMSYEAVYGPVLKKLLEATRVNYDETLLYKYAMQAGYIDWDSAPDARVVNETIAKAIGVEPSLVAKKVEPVQVIYSLADHMRALVFAMADGALPSNVAGGYNLRVLVRRSLEFLERYKWPITLGQVAEWHIEYLKDMFPELAEHRDEIQLILDVEREKYLRTKTRMEKVAEGLVKKGKGITVEEMVELYDSEGITPDFLRSKGLPVEVPPDFYAKITARHEKPRYEAEKASLPIEGLPPTRLIFYEDRDKFDFHGKVLRIFDGKHVVLDQTSFYPEGGGQVGDTGFLDGVRVVNAQKEGQVVVHILEKPAPFNEGDVVRGLVDGDRRLRIMRHHTATHIVNGAARRVLGRWVWQHSAYKSPDSARLDITHYAHLTPDLVAKIEEEANTVVQANIPLEISWLPRGEAENKYSFRLYQGGIYPGREVRVVKIGDYDIEACGGTHSNRTGDIGLIKILKAERIQDGVERLEYVAGHAAVQYLQKREAILQGLAEALETAPEHLAEVAEALKARQDQLRTRYKAAAKKFGSLLPRAIEGVKEVGGLRLYTIEEEVFDEEYHLAAGEEAVKADPLLVYSVFVKQRGAVRVIVFAGKKAIEKGVKAGEIAQAASKALGGSGGGDLRFGQGGGKKVDALKEARKAVTSLIASSTRSR